MKYKKCSACNQYKKVDYFYNNARNVDKKSDFCKKCHDKITHQYAKNNRVEIRKRQRENHLKLKTSVINKYGGICNCCGENTLEFLAIDHINKDGAQKRKAGMKGAIFYRWLNKNPVQRDLRVLCHNCNMAIGMYGKCPHKR